MEVELTGHSLLYSRVDARLISFTVWWNQKINGWMSGPKFGPTLSRRKGDQISNAGKGKAGGAKRDAKRSMPG